MIDDASDLIEAIPKFLAGGGELGRLMREKDWRGTSLGAPEDWPQSLKTAVRIMLTSRQPIWIGWGAELTYLYNDPYKAIIGGKHPWALGRPTSEVWREIWGDIGPLLDTALGGEEGTYSEQQLLIMERHGYREETYYTFSYSPIPDDDGNPAGIICANTDDTQRVIGERQIALLRELAATASPARFWQEACALSAKAFAVDPHDLPFATIYAVDRASDALRLCAHHGIAPGHGAAPETISLAVETAASRALRTGEPQIVTDLRRRYHDLPTGAWPEPPELAVVLRIPAAGEQGRSGVMVVGLNPYRQFDDKYRGFLDLIAGQMSAAIANADAYEHERRRAEALAEIDRAKTTFFSNISHEFRTPLTLMLGPLEEALARADGDDASRAQMDLAHRNGLRLLKLVNTLLDFSRIEAGRTQGCFRPLDLGQAVAELASAFRPAAEQAGLSFTIASDDVVAPVYVDHDMLEKIVLNLLSNAFKFTLDGGITVTTGPGREPGTAEISIIDTGVGIPAPEIPRLFERFHRVQGAKGRSFEGSGIGLALVRELVDLHHGRIEVDSRENEGSRFRVILPLGSAHLPADQLGETDKSMHREGLARAYVEEAMRWLPDIQYSAEPEQAVEAGDGIGRTVLLVDDNADMRDYVARLLSDAGFDVVTAADGELALARLHEKPVDLVLTDLMMPRLDGFGLLRAIRDDPSLAELPVVMLSARAGEEATVEGLTTGADDYLSKPFSARELIARVRANLALAQVRRQANTAMAARTAEREAANQQLLELNATLEQRVAHALAERKILADLVEGTDALVQVADKDFRWLAVNRAFSDSFQSIFGHRPQIGESMLDYMAGQPALLMPVRAIWERAFAGEEFTETIEFGEDTDRRWYESKFNVLRDAEGHQIGAFEFVYDITARIDEQERLRAAEEQLRQSQKMEAMGQLTGGVAHDFNNLLTPIIGALDLIRRSGLGSGREQRLIDGALQSADRAKTLVQRLLAFARRQPLQPLAVNVAELVQGMAELVSSTTGPQIRVAVEIADDVAPARAEPNQLEMAILNLAVNARDAMPDGGVLRISVANASVAAGERGDLRPGDYVRLSVADTGVGMDEATLARAIEPFFSTKGVGKGTGLGLSMVHGLAQQLNGSLTVRSQLGLGTNIELWLPRSVEEARPASSLGFVENVGAQHGLALLVDDEPLVRASTADMLKELGYEVIEADSAEQALQRLNEGLTPSVVVTDHLMPGINGVELARMVSARLSGTPTLIISGYANTDGIDPDLHRLTKPFLTADLAVALARTL